MNDTSSEDNDCFNNLRTFIFWFRLVSICVVIVLTCLQRRKFLWLDKLNGRPGIIYPVNLLDDRRNRYCYAAAFGMVTGSIISFFAYSLFGEGDMFGTEDMSAILKIVYLILFALVYGFTYYPVFIAITMGTLITISVGTFYAYVFTVTSILLVFACGTNVSWSEVLIQLPIAICASFLSVYFTIVLVKMIISRMKTGQFSANPMDTSELETYQMHYVKHLLYSSKIKQDQPSVESDVLTTSEKWSKRCKEIAKRLYEPRKGFRYSTRIVSTMTVSLIIIYQVYIVGMYAGSEFAAMGGNIRLLAVDVYVSLSLTCLLTICVMLHIIQQYRENMLTVYKGDHSLIPSVKENTVLAYSPAMRVVSASRYMGFQVAYMVWGFFIQFIVIAVGVGLLGYFLGTSEGRSKLWQLIKYLIPLILVGVLVTIVQYAMARFVFLQKYGRAFALDNRRLFHNFAYFMFFYNVFLGIASCLIRLGKTIAVVCFVMSRIDQSTLPRKYERLDPGFKAYVGFIQLENAHTHPILVTFCNLLISAVPPKTTDSANICQDVNMENSIDNTVDTDMKRVASDSQRRQHIRNKWYVALTLARNPGLQLKRKRDKVEPIVEMESIYAVVDDVATAALAMETYT